MLRPKVSACIVTFCCYEKVRRAIRTVLEHTHGVDLTFYVVDNASGDDTLQKLKAEFPSIIPIQNPVNKGFGDGHNQVLPLLESDFHAVINPDIEIDRDVLAELCAYMQQNGDVGLVTPKILFPDGRDQLIGKRDPSFLALVGRHLFKKRLKPHVDHYLMLDEDLTKPIDIEFATGSFFVIRTKIFQQIGGFDTRWFMYYEDMDITRRARAIARAIYYPYTYVYHAWERASSHKPKYFLILVWGMFKYFHKWGFKFRSR
jgi:GT2 family glycosyltransferase